jgi:hypothetical protein
LTIFKLPDPLLQGRGPPRQRVDDLRLLCELAIERFVCGLEGR